jgi:hypothetical protein
MALPTQPQSPSQLPVTSIPKVFGILSIIFGSLVLLGGLLQSCGGLASCAFGSMGDAMVANDPKAAEMLPMIAALKTVYAAMGVIGFVMAGMSGWLLAIGIGQLKYRTWARRASVVWGITALVVLLGMVLTSIIVIGPAYAHMIDAIGKAGGEKALPPGFAGGMSGIFGGSFSIAMVFFYAPYPVLLLALFTRPRVQAAMSM